MKAKVKETGVVIDVQECDAVHKGMGYDYVSTSNSYCYKASDLEVFIEPDYWEKLTHQAAIGAMQVMLASGVPTSLQYQHTKEADHHNVIADEAVEFAVSLVNKLKEKSECEK